jgi:hypothetical protein
MLLQHIGLSAGNKLLSIVFGLESCQQINAQYQSSDSKISAAILESI